MWAHLPGVALQPTVPLTQANLLESRYNLERLSCVTQGPLQRAGEGVPGEDLILSRYAAETPEAAMRGVAEPQPAWW